jgi:hypothetical protein
MNVGSVSLTSNALVNESRTITMFNNGRYNSTTSKETTFDNTVIGFTSLGSISKLINTNYIPTSTINRDKSNNYLYFTPMSTGTDYTITFNFVASVTLETDNLDDNITLSILDEENNVVLSVSGMNNTTKTYLDASKPYYILVEDNSAKYVVNSLVRYNNVYRSENYYYSDSRVVIANNSINYSSIKVTNLNKEISNYELLLNNEVVDSGSLAGFGFAPLKDYFNSDTVGFIYRITGKVDTLDYNVNVNFVGSSIGELTNKLRLNVDSDYVGNNASLTISDSDLVTT